MYNKAKYLERKADADAGELARIYLEAAELYEGLKGPHANLKSAGRCRQAAARLEM